MRVPPMLAVVDGHAPDQISGVITLTFGDMGSIPFYSICIFIEL